MENQAEETGTRAEIKQEFGRLSTRQSTFLISKSYASLCDNISSYRNLPDRYILVGAVLGGLIFLGIDIYLFKKAQGLKKEYLIKEKNLQDSREARVDRDY
jgi:hypothetical protein